MKVVKNSFIPFGSYRAVNLFGVVFVKGEADQILLNHEKIHSAQMWELFVVGFYLAYIIEWTVRLLMTHSFKKAYWNVSFEREAYANEADAAYLKNRKRYGFVKYFRS